MTVDARERAVLPPGFASLEPFAQVWAVYGTAQRAALRLNRSEAERETFFAAMAPELAGALTYLDRKPLAQLDDRERRLMDLLLSFCHVAMAVEIQGDAESAHATLRQHMKIGNTSADAPTQAANGASR
jgi:hypothetical protein